jgi:hypothetical protein
VHLAGWVDARCRHGRLSVLLSRAGDSGVTDQDVIAANRRIVRCTQPGEADTPPSARRAALLKRTKQHSWSMPSVIGEGEAWLTGP